MSTSDNDPDRIIREALRQEEAAGAAGGDPGMVELLVATFRGRNRLFVVGGVIVNLFLAGVALFGLNRFLGAEDVREMLVWGGAALLSIGLLVAVKIWYWMEMLRLAVTREVKRLEVQVSRLAERMQGPATQ